MLRKWKAQKTNAALHADGVTRLFRRPFGARECNPARRSGATGMSPTCTVLGSAPNAKRPTEAVKRTRTALLENELENESKSSAGPASGRETPLEERRGRLWGSRSGSRRRSLAAADRIERGFSGQGLSGQGRADDIRAMGQEMETHARVMPPCLDQRTSDQRIPIPACSLELEAEIRLETRRIGMTPLERLGRRRRSYEHRSSDKTSDARATDGRSRQGPRSRAHITRAGIKQAMSRIKTRMKSSMKNCAVARPPRKLLRVNGLGDKLGYPRATFVPPLIFLLQP
jgi:hypothetical protein